MSDSGEDIPEKYSPESWKQATKFAKLLGEMPSSFSTAIRTIRMEAGEQRDSTFTRKGTMAVKRLLKSPSLQAPIFFGAKALYPEKFKEPYEINEMLLMQIFGSLELSSVMGLLYVTRRISRMVDAEQLEPLLGDMHVKMALGAFVGKAIPRIGADVGIVMGGVRPLAMALFLSQDVKGWRTYSRQLKSSKQFCDYDFEIKRWGCTHLQVASSILQALGFGRSFAMGLSFGLDPIHLPDRESDLDQYRWHIADVWVRSLFKNGSAPAMTHRGDFYPLQDDLKELELRASQVVVTVNSPLLWMTKTKEDLPDASQVEAEDETEQEETETAVEEALNESEAAPAES